MAEKSRMPTLEKLLELNSFILVRQGKHNIFKAPTGHTLTVSRSASCPFAEKNAIGDLKRLVKITGRQFIDIDPRNGEVRNKTKVAEKVEEESQMKQTEVNVTSVAVPKQDGGMKRYISPAAPEPRVIDAEGLKLIIAGYQERRPQREIADTLNNLGYTTKRGHKFAQHTVAQILIANGHRTSEKAASKIEAKQEIKHTPPQAPKVKYSYTHDASRSKKKQRGEFIHQLTELLTSNLADDMKEQMAVIMFKQHLSVNG